MGTSRSPRRGELIGKRHGRGNSYEQQAKRSSSRASGLAVQGRHRSTHHVVVRLTARPPSGQEALELGTAPGVAVIAIQRTSIDTRGEVVETPDLVVSADRVAAVCSTHSARAGQPC
ncbi:UTRA domain-containing protein [Streptomyces albofaciens JCM 4342]|uniref:UTRA domain-containing protein n=1 Tax=Streptomyces albofaciens TaxID=66866 RepID=UPI0012390059|nr:UTRA domain-containing protein [Streptomyces albofaciens JCM 4342]